MGIITQTYPGEDGVVRVAVVRTSAGTYKRNVRTLAPLPIEGGCDPTTITENHNGSKDNQHAVKDIFEHEEDSPPQAPQMIWDGRLRPRPKRGRKWKYTKPEWVTTL